MSKFDRLIKFFQEEVSSKGAGEVVREIEELMHVKNLTEGMTVGEFLDNNNAYADFYFTEREDEFVLEYSFKATENEFIPFYRNIKRMDGLQASKLCYSENSGFESEAA